jgi:hypothetical protein
MSGTVEEKASRRIRVCLNPACAKAVNGHHKRKYCSAPCRDQANHAYRGHGGEEHKGGQGFRRLPPRCFACHKPTKWPRVSPDHDYTERCCEHCKYFVRVAEGVAAEIDPIQ